MRAAEEWYVNGRLVTSDFVWTQESHRKHTIEAIQAIQLDAFKAGMTHAAGIANDVSRGTKIDERSIALDDVAYEIISERDTLTALPEVKA